MLWVSDARARRLAALLSSFEQFQTVHKREVEVLAKRQLRLAARADRGDLWTRLRLFPSRSARSRKRARFSIGTARKIKKLEREILLIAIQECRELQTQRATNSPPLVEIAARMSSAPIRWALKRTGPQAAPCAFCLRLLGFVFPIGESSAIAYELAVDVAAIDGTCSEVTAVAVEADHPTGQSALLQFTGQRCARLAAAGVGLTISLTGLVQLGRVDAGEPQLPVVQP
jgi:hypothetical protein